MSCDGRPFVGTVDSDDASSGVAFTLYESGSLTSYTLASNEYLEIHSVEAVSAPGGDLHIFSGADTTAGAGETVVRGEVAANGGIVQELKPPHACQVGHSVYIVNPAGNVDAVIRGTIRRGGDGTTVKPSWREADQGQ